MNHRFHTIIFLCLIFCIPLSVISCRNANGSPWDANKPTTSVKEQKEDMLDWKEVLQLARKGSPAPDKRVDKSEEEWKALLDPEVFFVTRQKGTERAFTGAYCTSHAPGIYACICCGTDLFDANEKFDSGSGWPSFTVPLKNNVIKYEKDTSYGMVRVEVLCNTCDAHLGHVFPDGPGPGGLRFCINSTSIQRISE